MRARSTALAKLCWSAIDGATSADEVVFTGSGALPSAFAVTDIASATIATAALSIAEFLRESHGKRPAIVVDRRLSSIWFWASIRPLDWRPTAVWDPIAGDYPTRDGWIRLHTNAPYHRAAAERVLRAQGDKETIARAVVGWLARDLENAIVEDGGCAAEMRSIAAWEEHPQGRAVAAEPLVHFETTETNGTLNLPLQPARPLEGLRVLDLTRVLAGPVATRFLAGYGAEVLRIDPPDWDEPAVVPEVTLGKRCARLNLHESRDRAIFEQLLSRADVLIHGYRPGALDGLGYDAKARQKLSPGLVDVSLDAYGWSGPWATRRGFDSLVQMSTGIADFGMQRSHSTKPVPLPVQAVDHATGYLMAAAAIRGITLRMKNGHGSVARLSLARTAKLVIEHPTDTQEASLAAETETDRSQEIELTTWGKAQRIVAPVQIAGAPLRWDVPARQLGSDTPHWRNA